MNSEGWGAYRLQKGGTGLSLLAFCLAKSRRKRSQTGRSIPVANARFKRACFFKRNGTFYFMRYKRMLQGIHAANVDELGFCFMCYKRVKEGIRVSNADALGFDLRNIKK